jgi:hypothetical protein
LYTHDNGGRPFLVIVDPKTKEFSVRARGSAYMDEEEHKEVPEEYTKTVVRPTLYDKVFVGNGDNSWEKGNSVLVRLTDGNYMYVGDSVFTFSTLLPSEETITSYDSRVGNSDVPYPYATSNKGNIYLMIEKVVGDPYQLFYYSSSSPKHFKTKQVHKRLF